MGHRQAPSHHLGSFFRKRARGGSQSFGIYLFFSPARTCGLRCAHPDPRASCALDPFGPHITSAMTLVARDADSCCLLMTQVHGSTPQGRVIQTRALPLVPTPPRSSGGGAIARPWGRTERRRGAFRGAFRHRSAGLDAARCALDRCACICNAMHVISIKTLAWNMHQKDLAPK